MILGERLGTPRYGKERADNDAWLPSDTIAGLTREHLVGKATVPRV
jgi:hypothetical protein